MKPHYKGFTGEFVEGNEGFNCHGRCYWKEDEDNILIIDELPVLKWTKDYKTFLESLIEDEVIEDMREYHTHNKVWFELLIPALDEIEQRFGFDKFFKLSNKFSTQNYVLYNSEGKITWYPSEVEIMEEFFKVWENLYKEWKDYMVRWLNRDLMIIDNKIRFITEVINETIEIWNKGKQIVFKALKDKSYQGWKEI